MTTTPTPTEAARDESIEMLDALNCGGDPADAVRALEKLIRAIAAEPRSPAPEPAKVEADCPAALTPAELEALRACVTHASITPSFRTVELINAAARALKKLEAAKEE